MNAILLAEGEIQPDEPLYAAGNGRMRAMLEIAGQPMFQWVLQALDQAQAVEQIVIVGLSPESSFECTKPVALLADQGTILKNIQAGAREVMRLDPGATHAVLVSSDIPALRAEMVDWLVEQAQTQRNDIDYTVIERSEMERVFPLAQKTYMHLKNIDVCGGDLHCFRLAFAMQDNPLWNRLIAGGQNRLRQAALLGYDTLFILLLRQLNLKQAAERISKRLGLQGRALLCPYPQVGLDVNKPAHLEIAREYFARSRSGRDGHE